METICAGNVIEMMDYSSIAEEEISSDEGAPNLMVDYSYYYEEVESICAGAVPEVM